MPQRYVIREYEGFTREGASAPGLTPLPARTFDQLERMILLNRREDGATLPKDNDTGLFS